MLVISFPAAICYGQKQETRPGSEKRMIQIAAALHNMAAAHLDREGLAAIRSEEKESSAKMSSTVHVCSCEYGR
jgi:hypothetical protein